MNLDLIGKCFGRLIVIDRSSDRRNIWKCSCSCGKEINSDSYSLTHGKIVSCGCRQKEIINELFINHETKDLSGEIFGRLTVRKDSGNLDRGAKLWLCKCDCGNEHLVTTYNLTSGGVRSCGCLKQESDKRKDIKARKPRGESSFNALYGNYRSRANRGDLKFSLSKKEFKKLTSSNCHYCNRKPEQISKTNSNTGTYIYNGIDRIDSSKGYETENCVPCCKKCNFAKRDMPIDDFLDLIRRIYEHSCTA